MANTLDNIFPKILSSSLKTLREESIMPSLVNRDYSQDAAEKGSVINVPVPTQLEAQDVVPGPYSQSTQDFEIKTVPIPLNNWKEVPFYLTDKDIGEIMDGVPNMELTEASRALCNTIDLSLVNLYPQIFNAVGVAGTTPFADDKDDVARQARKLLGKWLTPLKDRAIVLDLEAEAEALGLPGFVNYQNSNDDQLIKEGRIGRKYGFDWMCDQLMVRHPDPTLNTLTMAVNGAVAKGASTMSVDAGTLTGGLRPGDLFTVAGDTQTYTVLAAVTAASNAMTYSFSPVAQTTFADNAVVTFKAGHAVNLAFHRDAFALAVRPLVDQVSAVTGELGGQKSMVMVDDVTGIPLRLEVKREHKRTRWSLDILWGVGLVRPQCAVRILG